MEEVPTQGIRTSPKLDEGSTRQCMQFIDGVRHRVAHGRLHLTVAALFWIEIGRVRRQFFEKIVFRIRREERLHFGRAMDAQPVPDHHEGLADLTAEMAQRIGGLFPMYAAAKVPCIQPGASASMWCNETNHAGDFTPLRQSPKGRWTAYGRPGRGDGGPKRTTRFVHEDNDSPSL